jgi:hypothetical protein
MRPSSTSAVVGGLLIGREQQWKTANDPGVVMYNKCLDWARDHKKMKTTKDYTDLQVECNNRSALNWVSSRYWLDPGSDEDDEGTQERVSRVDRSLVLVEASFYIG